MTSPAPTAPPAPPRSSPTPVRPGRPPARALVRRRRRRRRAVVLAAAALAALSLVVVAVGPVRDGLGRLVPRGSGSATVPASGSLLLAWPTADDGGAVITMLGGPRGSALLVPGRTQVEVPSFGSRTLAEAFRTAGAGTLALAFENALGYDAADVVALDAATLAALWQPAAPLDVRLRRPVRVGDDAFPATPLRLTAEEAAHLATTRPDDATDFDHLVVVHALLEAWLAGLDGDVLGLTEDALVEALALDRNRAAAVVAALDDLSRRNVTFDTLDVVSLGVPGEERYALDADAVGREMASLFPGLAFVPDGTRVRVEILNGTGGAGLATDAAKRIVPAGAHVVLTGNASQFGIETTLVVLQDARFEADARRLVAAMGVGELRMARNPVGVADVSIVIGADFRARSDPGGG